VAKDGKLIHESYFANTSETKYETDSAGKMMTAALMGVAVQQGLLDIDKPIKQYGVKPKQYRNAWNNASFLWNKTGVDFFDNVTTRHLLTQTNGFGLVPPGSKFTYNSDDYIQHLSYVLSAVSRQDAVTYASDNFAAPLGVPDYYTFDNSGIEGSGTHAPIGDFSAGGGQMATCKDLLRVGQLLLNKGKWKKGDVVTQLIPETYARQALKPSFPHANAAYGFLTWLNQNVTAHPIRVKTEEDGKNATMVSTLPLASSSPILVSPPCLASPRTLASSPRILAPPSLPPHLASSRPLCLPFSFLLDPPYTPCRIGEPLLCSSLGRWSSSLLEHQRHLQPTPVVYDLLSLIHPPLSHTADTS
jgi:CubicO group peptidase (beta-lactamase class C family)